MRNTGQSRKGDRAMKETVMLGLKIMGYGMAGIFVAAVVIIACVWLLQVSDRLGAKKETKEE